MWCLRCPGPADSAQYNSIIPATINNPQTVQDLTVGAGAMVAVVSNSDPTISSSLTVLGTANDAGTIQANSTTTDPTISFDQAVTIQSGGTIESDGGQAMVFFLGGIDNFGTLEANHGSTISIAGTATNEIGATIEALNGATITISPTNGANLGTIDADGGTINIILSGTSGDGSGGNFGLIEALHGGTISISGASGASFNNAGTIEANGGVVIVDCAVTGTGSAIITGGGT